MCRWSSDRCCCQVLDTGVCILRAENRRLDQMRGPNVCAGSTYDQPVNKVVRCTSMAVAKRLNVWSAAGTTRRQVYLHVSWRSIWLFRTQLGAQLSMTHLY